MVSVTVVYIVKKFSVRKVGEKSFFVLLLVFIHFGPGSLLLLEEIGGELSDPKVAKKLVVPSVAGN